MSTNTIAGYSVAETLFEGARSIIYKATNGDGRAVVIKVLAAEYPSLEQIAGLRREYRMTREAHTEGVVEVVGLERYRSASPSSSRTSAASSALAACHPSRSRRAVIGFGVRLAGTGRVHQRRLIHKDINPANIVVHPATGVVKLIDFGIATTLTRESATRAAPPCSRARCGLHLPEQTGRMNRTVDYRTDFYSLGVTLYELLTGQPAFVRGRPVELVHCHLARAPTAAARCAGAPDPVARRSSSSCWPSWPRIATRAPSASPPIWPLRPPPPARHGRVAAFVHRSHDVSDRFQLPQKLYGRERRSTCCSPPSTASAAAGRRADAGRRLLRHRQERPGGRDAPAHRRAARATSSPASSTSQPQRPLCS